MTLSADSLCGVYAINNTLGGPLLTEEACNTGARLAAAELGEHVRRHRDIHGLHGDLGGDYSLAALNEALRASTNVRIDFVRSNPIPTRHARVGMGTDPDTATSTCTGTCADKQCQACSR